jgi:hypothetical protein
MKQKASWKIGAVGLCTGLLLALLLAAPLLAANRPVVQQQTASTRTCRVRSGEVLEGDITVLNGEVTVDSDSESGQSGGLRRRGCRRSGRGSRSGTSLLSAGACKSTAMSAAQSLP